MFTFSEIPEWVKHEHDVAKLLQIQEEYGWRFDERAAWELASSLQQELDETCELLRNRHPFVFGSEFTPKRNNRTSGYVEGCTFTRIKETNITSRDHIAWILQTFHGWNPKHLTATGKPIIDEVTLKEAASDGITIAEDFLKCLDITKKLGMISQGTNAWLKLCTSAERIHHHCSTGAATFRCSHRNPNLAQVPSDERFRRLFIATPGSVLVGADLSGVELRMLAHYLSKHDGGRYADILLNGDIHQVNADKIGISRKLVKTVTYAFLYGAGDEKIGHSYDKQLSSSSAKRKGKEIKQAYIEAIEGLDKLLADVKSAAERGFIRAIDQRKILVDSPHKALNFLLQGSSACLAKRWLTIAHDNINQLGIKAHQLAFIHDELQYETTPNNANDLSTSLVLSATEAGEYYRLRIRIDAESNIGNNWAETH
jgi:DNA polymerase I-like protein with 3'-5' exonuclease and polymerase domains